MKQAQVTIIGAGTMGTGIAGLVASSGFAVRLLDLDAAILERAAGRLAKAWAGLVAKGRMSEAQQADALRNISYGQDWDTVSSSGIIIEAVTEDVEVKRTVFARIAEIASPEALICSNTSSLNISELASLCCCPERLLGMHFFNPPAIMKLVELVPTERTSEAALSRAKTFVAELGKEGVLVRESCGFVVNRLLIPMINEAALLYGEGVASAEVIDKAMKLGANHPIGPLALADLIGLDVCLAIMESLQRGLGSDKYAPAPALRDLVGQGKQGRKSGEGFLKYG